MKIKNFIKGNYRFFGTGSEVYYGIIQMNKKEFEKAKKYLLKCKLQYKEMLKKDLQVIETFKGGYQLTVRVEATEKLVNYFKIPRYKRQNYIIQVLND